MKEVGAVYLGGASQLCSGGNDGRVKFWDITAAARKASSSILVSSHAWVRHIEHCPTVGLHIIAHSDGLSLVDPRSKIAVHALKDQGQAYRSFALAAIGGPPSMLVCAGHRLLHYDFRSLADVGGSTPHLNAWEFKSNALGLHCCALAGPTDDARSFYIAAGCKDGSIWSAAISA